MASQAERTPMSIATRKNEARIRALAGLMLCAALAACGGSDDDPSAPPEPGTPVPAPGTPAPSPGTPAPAPGTPTPPPLASGVAAMEGNWVSRKVCTPLGTGQSAYQLVRIVRQSDIAVDYQSGTMLYNGANCQGVGSALASSMGTVTFTRVESNAQLASHWGVWRTIAGGIAYVVWAKPDEATLCMLGDENPSILPTLDRVAQSMNVQNEQNGCYSKL